MPAAFPSPLEQTAIINGASRGIGLEVARRLLKLGWNVCITGRKPEALELAERDLVATAGAQDRVLAMRGSSEDPDHQREVIEAVLARWGRLDALVNNAAMSPYYGPITTASQQQITRALEVNLVAPWSWSMLAYELWMGDHGGVIVNTGSIGGVHPVRNSGVYNITKAALHHLTKQLALELAPGVRVNAVAPATIKTDFSKAKYEGREAELAASYPLQRLGTADEVAAAIALFCGDELSWVTGQILVLDGGISLLQGTA